MSHTSAGGKSPTIVCAGVLIEGGRVLLTQRKPDAHLAGAWEFPGGKVAYGEEPRAALQRELAEELGIEVSVGRPLEVTQHSYPEKTVLLLFFQVQRTAESADPQAIDVAAFRWAAADDLDEREFPAADVDVLRVVRTMLR